MPDTVPLSTLPGQDVPLSTISQLQGIPLSTLAEYARSLPNEAPASGVPFSGELERKGYPGLLSDWARQFEQPQPQPKPYAPGVTLSQMASDPVALAQGQQLAGAFVGSVKRPYENVPDTLMGFRKSGQNTPYELQNWKFEQPVKVTFPDTGDVFEDSVKGLNQSHALERARRNWPGATIEPLQGGGAEVPLGSLPPQLSGK